MPVKSKIFQNKETTSFLEDDATRPLLLKGVGAQEWYLKGFCIIGSFRDHWAKTLSHLQAWSFKQISQGGEKKKKKRQYLHLGIFIVFLIGLC